MGIIIIPPMTKLPDDLRQAQEQRKEFYGDYCRELSTLNPHLFNMDGSRKSVWKWLWDLIICRNNGILSKP
jgi:hypothetical protein